MVRLLEDCAIVVKRLELEVETQLDYRSLTINAGHVEANTKGTRKAHVSIVAL
jgi:hypothetical protein